MKACIDEKEKGGASQCKMTAENEQKEEIKGHEDFLKTEQFSEIVSNTGPAILLNNLVIHNYFDI